MADFSVRNIASGGSPNGSLSSNARTDLLASPKKTNEGAGSSPVASSLTQTHPPSPVNLYSLFTRTTFTSQESVSDQFLTSLAAYRQKISPTPSSVGSETNYSFSQYFMDGTLIKASAEVSTNPNFNDGAYDYLRSQHHRAIDILVQAFDSSKSDLRQGAADQSGATCNPLDVFDGVNSQQFRSLFLKKIDEINPAALAAATISPFIDFSGSLTEAQQEKIFTYLLVLILLFTFDDIVADAKIPPQRDETLGEVYRKQTNRVTDFVARLIEVLFLETFEGDDSIKESERANYLNGKKKIADYYAGRKDFFSDFLKQIMESITQDIQFKNIISRQLKDYLNSVVQEAAYQELAISEGRPTNIEDFNRNRRVNGAVLPCLQAALAIAGVRIDKEQYITFRLNIGHAIDNITKFNDIRSATKEFSKGHDLTNLVGIYRAHSGQSAELGSSHFFQEVAREAAGSKRNFLRLANDHIKTFLIAIESESRYAQEELTNTSSIIASIRSKSSFIEIELDDEVHSCPELLSLSHLIRAYQVIYHWMTGHEAWEFCGNRHGKYDITAEKLDRLIPLINNGEVLDLASITDQKLKKTLHHLLNYKLGDNPTNAEMLAKIESIKADLT